MFTFLSQASVLNRLSVALRAEQEGASKGRTTIVVNGSERRSGIEGLRRTVGDVRAARVHQLSMDNVATGFEDIIVNYWADR